MGYKIRFIQLCFWCIYRIYILLKLLQMEEVVIELLCLADLGERGVEQYY